MDLVSIHLFFYSNRCQKSYNILKNEINLLKEFKKIGFLNNYEFARNVAIRFTARVLPKSFIKQIYKLLRKND